MESPVCPMCMHDCSNWELYVSSDEDVGVYTAFVPFFCLVCQLYLITH